MSATKPEPLTEAEWTLCTVHGPDPVSRGQCLLCAGDRNLIQVVPKSTLDATRAQLTEERRVRLERLREATETITELRAQLARLQDSNQAEALAAECEELRAQLAKAEAIYRETATAVGADSLAATVIAKHPEELVIAAQQRSHDLAVTREALSHAETQLAAATERAAELEAERDKLRVLNKQNDEVYTRQRDWLTSERDAMRERAERAEAEVANLGRETDMQEQSYAALVATIQDQRDAARLEVERMREALEKMRDASLGLADLGLEHNEETNENASVFGAFYGAIDSSGDVLDALSASPPASPAPSVATTSRAESTWAKYKAGKTISFEELKRRVLPGTPEPDPPTPPPQTPDERQARMEAVWQKHLSGALVTLDEFLARRSKARR